MEAKLLRLLMAIMVTLPLITSQATADSRVLRFAETQELLSDGKVISSSSLTSLPRSDSLVGASPPKDTRIHEMFILYRSELYLCHLVASKASGTRPYATCYGSWADQ